MFIGHFAPAFVAAAVTPDRPRLGVYFIAAQLVDWAFYLFVLAGIEDFRVVPGFTVMKPFFFFDYPITHSLVGALGWSVGFGLLASMLWSRRAGLLAGGVVFSHWLLDLASHGRDLTIAGGQDRFGLGLWNYPLASIGVELIMTLAAFAFYLHRTRGSLVAPLVLLAAMVAMQVLNWLGSAPEAVGAALVLTALLATGILTALAFWCGAVRETKPPTGLAQAA
ncbi:MAG: hypothetical protein CL808_04185 [Citromicrobium sp.]|nr:hypothetical protein [Citromicrobium sp.]